MERRDHTRSSIILFFSYVCVFLIGLVSGVALVYEAEKVNVSSDEAISVSMVIDYGAGDIQALPLDTVSSGTTLEKYIGIVMSRHGVPIDMRRIGDEVYIEAIHGVHASAYTDWIYHVRDSALGRDPSLYMLQDGDEVTWTLAEK